MFKLVFCLDVISWLENPYLFHLTHYEAEYLIVISKNILCYLNGNLTTASLIKDESNNSDKELLPLVTCVLHISTISFGSTGYLMNELKSHHTLLDWVFSKTCSTNERNWRWILQILLLFLQLGQHLKNKNKIFSQRHNLN